MMASDTRYLYCVHCGRPTCHIWTDIPNRGISKLFQGLWECESCQTIWAPLMNMEADRRARHVYRVVMRAQ